MTKVQLRYDLLRPLDDALMEKIVRVRSVYGILNIALAPTLDKLVVDYDASRLSALEVESVLHQAGLPIVLHV
ncbi:MAG TPA: hypothetical protein VFB75_17380 [Burkholderiales bacterium]|nr:hypothetical protein [Burkholderiales bacterium]